uniref:Uncharacterized protein n=1 Tax=Moniliophthora roreri TaxID=221103 RepID=A0A0W0EYG5_MONRR
MLGNGVILDSGGQEIVDEVDETCFLDVQMQEPEQPLLRASTHQRIVPK